MADFTDLGEHTGTLIAMIGALLFIAGAMVGAVWKIMTTIALNLKTDLLQMFDSVWVEINKIKENQMKLRSEIPEKYMQKSDYAEVQHERLATLGRIEGKLDTFIGDCKSGNCPGGNGRRG